MIPTSLLQDIAVLRLELRRLIDVQTKASMPGRVEPPRFDGENAPDWIRKIQNYYDLLYTPPEDRLYLTKYLFDHPASDWMEYWTDNNAGKGWDDFLVAVKHRFHHDPDADNDGPVRKPHTSTSEPLSWSKAPSPATKAIDDGPSNLGSGGIIQADSLPPHRIEEVEQMVIVVNEPHPQVFVEIKDVASDPEDDTVAIIIHHDGEADEDAPKADPFFVDVPSDVVVRGSDVRVSTDDHHVPVYEVMSEFPLDPLLSKMLVASKEYGCFDEIVSSACMLLVEEKDSFCVTQASDGRAIPPSMDVTRLGFSKDELIFAGSCILDYNFMFEDVAWCRATLQFGDGIGVRIFDPGPFDVSKLIRDGTLKGLNEALSIGVNNEAAGTASVAAEIWCHFRSSYFFFPP